MINGIGHIAFTATDMEKTLNFYCNILSLKKVFEINDDKGNPWIIYLKICDGQFLELFYGYPQACKDTSYSHLCLEVDNINEIAEKLSVNNIKLDVEPVQGKDLNYQCWARDPDGNRIEFMQMHPDSPQKRF